MGSTSGCVLEELFPAGPATQIPDEGTCDDQQSEPQADNDGDWKGGRLPGIHFKGINGAWRLLPTADCQTHNMLIKGQAGGDRYSRLPAGLRSRRMP